MQLLLKYKCKIMINRINLILRAKNITARQFAEEIGIQPSGMSHILGGRNNPSLDFAVKVLKRYPEIDANWLLLGKGAMYGNGTSVAVTEERNTETAVPQQTEADFSGGDAAELPKAEDYQATYMAVPSEEYKQKDVESEDFGNENRYVAPQVKHANDGDRTVVRMMLIYSDNTFDVLTPRS